MSSQQPHKRSQARTLCYPCLWFVGRTPTVSRDSPISRTHLTTTSRRSPRVPRPGMDGHLLCGGAVGTKWATKPTSKDPPTSPRFPKRQPFIRIKAVWKFLSVCRRGRREGIPGGGDWGHLPMPSLPASTSSAARPAPDPEPAPGVHEVPIGPGGNCAQLLNL